MQLTRIQYIFVVLFVWMLTVPVDNSLWVSRPLTGIEQCKNYFLRVLYMSSLVNVNKLALLSSQFDFSGVSTHCPPFARALGVSESIKLVRSEIMLDDMERNGFFIMEK